MAKQFGLPEYEVLDRIGVPRRRWVPIALLAAVVLDGVKPFAVGDAAGWSFAGWFAVCLVVTWFRNRRTAIELAEEMLVITEPARRIPRAITVAEIATIAPVKVGSRTTFIVRTQENELIALPTPLGTWWMQGEEPYVTEHNARIQNWLTARRLAATSSPA